MKRKSLIISLSAIAVTIFGAFLHYGFDASVHRVETTELGRSNESFVVDASNREQGHSTSNRNAKDAEETSRFQSSVKAEKTASPPTGSSDNTALGSPYDSTRSLYDVLITTLYLHPYDEKLFIDYLHEMQTKVADLRDSDPVERTIHIEAIRSETEKKIFGLLGPDGFSQYKQYEKDLVEHLAVVQLADTLKHAGSLPLTQQQRDDLFLALKEDVAAVTPASTDQYQQRVAQAAKSILTPEQFAQYRQVQERLIQQQPLPRSTDSRTGT